MMRGIEFNSLLLIMFARCAQTEQHDCNVALSHFCALPLPLSMCVYIEELFDDSLLLSAVFRERIEISHRLAQGKESPEELIGIV